jgi:hypothetical protein
MERTTQAEDGIFEQQHGAASIAKLAPRKAGGEELMAELVVAVDPTATPSPVGMGGPGDSGGRQIRRVCVVCSSDRRDCDAANVCG